VETAELPSRLSRPQPRDAPAARWALLISTNAYDDDRLARLKSPLADVRGLATVLRNPEIGGFTEVDVLENRPSHEIRLVVSKFLRQRKAADLCVLYFTGHGVLDAEGALFLAGRDTDRDHLAATSVPAEFVRERMDRCVSRAQVLVLDCCHSGAFGRGAKASAQMSVGTAQAFRAEGPGRGRVVLAATDALGLAWEDERGSAFTRYLVDGLRTGEADHDGDGLVTVDELYEYAYDRIVTEAQPERPQQPYRSVDGGGNIVIARSPQLFDDIAPRVVAADPAIRLGAVATLRQLAAKPLMRESALAHLEQLRNDDSKRVADEAQRALAGLLPPRTRRWPATLISAAAGAGLAIGAWSYMHPNPRPVLPAPAAPEPRSSARPPAPERPQPPAPPSATPAADPEPPSPAASPTPPRDTRPAALKSYKVSITTEPSDAEIRLDGKRVGRGAYSGVLPRDGAKHALKFTRAGYQTKHLTFTDEPPELTVVPLEEAPHEAAEPHLKRIEAKIRDKIYSTCLALDHKEHGTLELAVDVEGGQVVNVLAYEELAGSAAARCVENAIRAQELPPGAEGHYFFRFSM
jgi:uncharacterized caspase-like protein